MDVSDGDEAAALLLPLALEGAIVPSSPEPRRNWCRAGVPVIYSRGVIKRFRCSELTVTESFVVRCCGVWRACRYNRSAALKC